MQSINKSHLRASLNNNNNNSHSSGQRSSRSSAETVAVKGRLGHGGSGGVDGGSGGISSGQPDLLKETIRWVILGAELLYNAFNCYDLRLGDLNLVKIYF